jgi:hypothetical protein
MYTLLTRDQFREAVFKRDGYKCVVCKKDAVDAHHILERRLWSDGGYYLENGASLCSEHHMQAETTALTVERLRDLCGIAKYPMPEHLYPDQPYDKWGNPILPNGQRVKGELFNDSSVQKILDVGGFLKLFTDRVKYPRTYHLPWSPGLTSDDRKMRSLEGLEGQDVVVMVKMDGENTSLYSDGLHCRSLDYEAHPSRNLMKVLHASIAYNIPKGWKLSVENLFAKHSIHYKSLPDYAVLFGIWDDKNYLISWNETKEWGELLGLSMCPVLYEGKWDETLIKGLYTPTYDGDECEGYVVRVQAPIHYRDFKNKVGKYVRAGHVPVHGGHWARRQVIQNELKKK